MAHRRKSSHPMCKTRRHVGSNWEPSQQQSEDDDDEVTEESHTLPGQGQIQGHEDPVSMETTNDSGQPIMIPPDLFKDFEAVRSQTKLDATDLMRRLLKDYQSISTTGDKPLVPNVHQDDHHDNEVDHQSSIATDVSLATARVDTDEDEFQGLDLSVRSRKINSRLFDTKSLETGETSLEQPLDLTCSKPPVTSESLDRESPSSTQLEGVHNEFNYVYVYPGLYPPGSGLLPHEEMEGESHNTVTSPVPELISPGRLSPPISALRSPYMPTTDPLEKNFALMNPGLAYSNFMNTMAKTALPESISPTPRSTPNLTSPIKQEPYSIKQEPYDIQEPPTKKSRAHPHTQMSKSSAVPGHHHEKQNKPRDKKSNEMKVISENTSYPGVYTSVMKLPWSRRTRTKAKKPKHKLKLEDTLIPQFMLDEANQNESQAYEPRDKQQQMQQEIRNPSSSQSVMMVYPNATNSSYGKPVRRRGRPPKLPMLAKLLQHEQASKRALKEKKQQQEKVDESQAQIQQQVQANGGMLVYNSGGQVVTAYPGVPAGQPPPTQQPPPQQQQPVLQPAPPTTSTETSVPQIQNIAQLPPHMMPNMSQAQFLGQVPLSQIMGGPIQFLGQFPANAVPLPGQALPGIPIPSQEQPSNTDDDSQNPKPDVMPPANFQYAFQPFFIPTPMQPPVPVPQPAPPSTETANTDVTDGEMTPAQPIDQPALDTQMPPSGSSPDTSFMPDNLTHEMKHENSNTISTMSTTSIANTETGAMYQEMILSSKSLVNVKKRKRQTAIQLLKSKSGDQDFLCTSFRIRPRLVAQAQAQRERMSNREASEVCETDEIDTDSKNLYGPQNDMVHFGENSNTMDDDNDDADTPPVKTETDFDELCKAYGIDSAELDIKQEVSDESLSHLEDIVPKHKPNKHFMTNRSKKKRSKLRRGRTRSHNGNELPEETSEDKGDDSNMTDNHNDSEMFQEMFNCKLCNTMIPVHKIEEHSLEHVRQNRHAARMKCCTCGGQLEKATKGFANECDTCKAAKETSVNLDNPVYSTHGHGKIACDECPETFKSLPDFYEHKAESHKDSDPKTMQKGEFECDYCGKVYQYFHALQFHRRTHRDRKVQCFDQECNLKFKSRREMENHFEVAHPDKKEYYYCEYDGCSKKFLKNFHLQEHIRVKHYNIKAFQCPWPGCVKEFAAQRHLKIHLLIHRDEKPMKCEHCDYRCRQRSAMNWHMRKHPDVPYKYKRSTKPPSVSATESE